MHRSQGSRKVEALAVGAVELTELLELVALLNAFCDRLQAEGRTEPHDRIGERLSLCRQVVDERLCDLEDVYWKSLQNTQRRVAGTEVVDCKAHPCGSKLFERLGCGLGIVDESTLRDLQDDVSRIEPGVLGPSGEVRDEGRLIEFSRSLLESAKGGIVAGVGVAILFWTVIKVLTHVEKSFNVIWGVKEHRSLGRRFADYLSVMVICPVLLIVSGGLTVAISSRVQAVMDSISMLGFLAPVLFVGFQGLADAVPKFLFLERLFEEVDRPGLHRPDRHLYVAVAGYEDHR